MNYVLKLELTGADTIKNALGGLQNVVRSISNQGGVLGGGSAGQSGIGKQAEDIGRLVRQVEKGKVGVHALGRELKNLGRLSQIGAIYKPGSIPENILRAMSPADRAMYESMAGAGPSLPWRNYNMATRFRTGLMGWATPSLAQPFPNPYSGPVPPMLKTGAGGSSFGTMAMEFIAQYLTISLALRTFRRAVETASDAVQKGYGIYTKSAASGVTPGLYSYRNSLADIFGVQGNPNQVFMFGRAVKEVSDRIADSTRTLAANSPQLAQVAMNAKILKLDFDAFASDLITKLSPAINIFLAAMDVLVKQMMKWASAIAQIAVVLNIGAFQGALGIFGLAGKGGLNAVSQFSKPLPSMLPMLMKQMPGSAWENMGLSIGPNLGNEIVKQIKTSNSYLKHLPMIASALGASGGVPRSGTFGMNPLTNNP